MFCPKQFRIQSRATKHERSHTGETPYACSMCPKHLVICRHAQPQPLTIAARQLPHTYVACRQHCVCHHSRLPTPNSIPTPQLNPNVSGESPAPTHTPTHVVGHPAFCHKKRSINRMESAHRKNDARPATANPTSHANPESPTLIQG